MCTFAYQAVSENRKQSINDHTEILIALKKGNIAKAKILMNEHNKFSGTTYMKRKLEWLSSPNRWKAVPVVEVELHSMHACRHH